MKLILTIHMQDIVSGTPVRDTAAFRKRSAARAVLLDDAGRIYLLNVSKRGHHKLPGGGIDEGEGIQQALQRELMEELGCRADIIAELGTIIEYRYDEDGGGLKQTSYCFLAKQAGEQIESALEEGELSLGMHEVKTGNIDQAIALMVKDKPIDIDGKFIHKRDLAFLQAAKQQLQ